MSIAVVMGLVFDAAMGGMALARAFQEFRQGRSPDETEKQAAAAYVKRMVAEIRGEEKADTAIDAWLEKHGS